MFKLAVILFASTLLIGCSTTNFPVSVMLDPVTEDTPDVIFK